MSDTPETDAMFLWREGEAVTDAIQRFADFARTLELRCAELTARVAELEAAIDEANDFFGIYELLWKAFPSAGAGSTLKVAIKFAIKEHEEVKAALTEARKRVAELEANADYWKLRFEAAELERACAVFQRDALLEITWLDFPGEPHESTKRWRDEFGIGWERKAVSDELRAQLTEARKDGQRIDAIIANKWTITWNYLRDSFIVQSKDQVCGNIGHSKPLRELLDDAAVPLPTKEDR